MGRRIVASYKVERSFQRQTLRGVVDFVAETGRMEVVGTDWHEPALSSGGAIDGAVGNFTREMPPPPYMLGAKPMVSTANSIAYPGISRVVSDDAEIGRMAAMHLLEQGYRRQVFIYRDLGTPIRYVRLRQAGWRRGLRAAGVAGPFPILNIDDPQVGSHLRDMLPGPIGVAASLDQVAVGVARLCQAQGLHVPDDVAILGVNDDDLLCASLRPTLSSIDPDRRRVGYEAAAELDRLLDQPGRRPRVIRIQPRGVVPRESTQPVPVHEPLVRRALDWIRGNIARPVTVEELIRDLDVSRRTLELAFARTLGRTPLAEIRRSRIERARSLLVQTQLPMGRIAAACGFADQRYFSTTFRRLTGETPTAYRRHART